MTLASTLKTLLVRKSSTFTSKAVAGRCMSKVARWNNIEYSYETEDEGDQVQSFKHEVQDEGQDKQCYYEERGQESSWIPDPRTGIYYPKGQEWVMKDVPVGAASFGYSYWLRDCGSTDHA